MNSPETKLVVGCGYLGLRAANRWRAAGDDVIAITRSSTRALEFRYQHGLRAVVADVLDLASLGNPPHADSMLYAVGFDRNAGDSIHEVYAGGLQNVLAAVSATVRHVIYISTTGVYGDAAGDWVDESTPPDPQREGGRASFAAEQVLAAHPLGRRSAILRLAGLYGPGRIPYLAQLKAGEPIAAPRDGWLNLIHVDDAAAVVLAADRWLAARTSSDGPYMFCVSDGTPVVRGDYYGEVARLLGAPPPQFVPPPADSPALARAGASRRVSNRKLLETLGVKLAYPSYSAGLAVILGAVENESR